MSMFTTEFIVNRVAERQTVPFDDPRKPRANISAIQSHLSLFYRKLIIIFICFFTFIIGLSATAIGILGITRHCKVYRQPSIPVWLLVSGILLLILSIWITTMICASITCKYKSGDGIFKSSIVIALFAVNMLVTVWTFGSSITSMFTDPDLSLECLGFIYDYGWAHFTIMFICLMIYSIYWCCMATKTVHGQFCCKKKNLQSQADLPIFNSEQAVITQCNMGQHDVAIAVPNVPTRNI
ncbi:unnamed protein product [Adineta ricciae]|uniref:Uncharacterized protein n=1 Tax=Adineta ricciae TaxID=249248 RepID=A0A815UB91_ADIRI|nr:unnamed protein product [Adineta ricciae]CAF1616697.1 unnamed protein product [Adineta ricciae]